MSSHRLFFNLLGTFLWLASTLEGKAYLLWLIANARKESVFATIQESLIIAIWDIVRILGSWRVQAWQIHFVLIWHFDYLFCKLISDTFICLKIQHVTSLHIALQWRNTYPGMPQILSLTSSEFLWIIHPAPQLSPVQFRYCTTLPHYRMDSTTIDSLLHCCQRSYHCCSWLWSVADLCSQ